MKTFSFSEIACKYTSMCVKIVVLYQRMTLVRVRTRTMATKTAMRARMPRHTRDTVWLALCNIWIG